jgi:hypothetical protein
MTIASRLERLDGYPFEVRYSQGSEARARASADMAADAYVYLSELLSGFTPDIAVVVVNRGDWFSRQPYGLPYFNDDQGQIRPGVVVMSADAGDFWIAMGEALLESSPGEYPKLLATYPDGGGGLDLQPFFDLVTVHELGHAFETLGGLSLPTFWLGEIFANLALHTFVAVERPESLATLEVLPSVGAASTALRAQMQAEGYTTLEELETYYTGGESPMSPLNYVWYQYRWQRLAADVFDADGEAALLRCWDFFRSRPPGRTGAVDAASLAPLLGENVSETLGRAIRDW